MIETAVSLIVAILMVATVLCDLRFMRIPNVLSLIGVGAFIALLAWSLPLDEVLWRGVIALLTLVLGFLLFAFGIVGAGDVKILSVLMLFVHTTQTAIFLFLFSAAMIAGIIVVLIARKFLENSSSPWAFLQNERRLPMGLSIGTAGLIQLFIS